MLCTVYRSSRKEHTYLYLAGGREYDDLPEDLRRMFGEPVEVLALDLERTPRLARVDIAAVRRHLADEGYFLQLPPRHPLDHEIEAGLGGRPVKRD